MITDSFDNQSNAIINPRVNGNAPQVDACISTFSYVIEEFVLNHYDCKQIVSFWFATGNTSIYRIDYKGKTFDNDFMSAEMTYKYYNEFIWNGRYAECISFEKALEMMKDKR